MSTKVLIVEDVLEFQTYIETLLSSLKEVSVSGLAKNTWEARSEIDRSRPDLVLLDEVLPGESAIDFGETCSSEGLSVLLMTSMEEPTAETPKWALGRVQKPSWDAASKAHEDRFLAELKGVLESLGPRNSK